jgi:hypothetical protein
MLNREYMERRSCSRLHFLNLMHCLCSAALQITHLLVVSVPKIAECKKVDSIETELKKDHYFCRIQENTTTTSKTRAGIKSLNSTLVCVVFLTSTSSVWRRVVRQTCTDVSACTLTWWKGQCESTTGGTGGALGTYTERTCLCTASLPVVSYEEILEISFC